MLQWVIYDDYQADFEAQQLEKERERERKEKDKMPATRTRVVKKVTKMGMSEIVQARLFECWKVLERMVNQNRYDDVAKGLIKLKTNHKNQKPIFRLQVLGRSI